MISCFHRRAGHVGEVCRNKPGKKSLERLQFVSSFPALVFERRNRGFERKDFVYHAFAVYRVALAAERVSHITQIKKGKRESHKIQDRTGNRNQLGRRCLCSHRLCADDERSFSWHHFSLESFRRSGHSDGANAHGQARRGGALALPSGPRLQRGEERHPNS